MARPAGLPSVRRLAARRAALVAAALCLACPKEELPRSGLGRRIAEGQVAALRASPGGAHLAWLGACAPVTAGLAPRGTRSCELRVAPAEGGAAEVVARGVTTLPHGFGWTGGGALLALASYDHAAGAGTLVEWRPGAGARTLAAGVSFHAAAPDGRVGWVAGGALWVAGEPVEGATRVATFEFAPAGGALRLLARREAAAGGELLAIPAGGGPPRRVAARAGDYRFSGRGEFAFTARDGEVEALAVARAAERPARLRRNVQGFAFAPGGGAIALLADLEPGRQPDLWVARLPAGGPPSAPEKLGAGVGELRWAAEGLRLAWLEGFDPATRSGALVAGAPGEAPARLGERVSAFELSPDGSRVAFLEHVLDGGYSVDLKLAQLGGGAPREGAPRVEPIARGAFGFGFSPDQAHLWYRAACTRNGESCDLLRVPAAGLAAGAPQPIARNVRSFDLHPGRPGAALVGFARADAELDLGLWTGGEVVPVDRAVLAGSAAFLGPEGRRVAYAVAEPGREGVYVAEAR